MKDKKIKLLINKINKKYGLNTLNFVKDIKDLEVERISSGSFSLDKALGKSKTGFGWPMGRFIELYGKESSGKSTIALLTIADAQKRGITCVYIDCESSFDPEYATLLGVNVDELILTQASIGEDVIDITAELLEQEQKMVIVIDSVASMVPRKEMEDPMDQQNIALGARLMSKAMRKLTALNKKSLVIFINQIRISPGKYGNPEVTPGGRALIHYSSIRLEVRRGEILEVGTGVNKYRIGQVVKFKVTKNKSAPPMKKGYFKLIDGSGVDSIDEVVSEGLINKAIKRRGAYFDILKETFQGREALEMKMEQDKDFRKKVEKEIMKK